MLRRRVDEQLKKWKDSPIRKVLILRGARQVGKTSVIRRFGQECFDDLIEINLEDREMLKSFDSVLSVEKFLQMVEIVFKRKVIEGKTLLFIDEVQQSKNIMEMLRFFAEDHPNLHVIVTGSLMDAVMTGKWNVPVGRVEYMYMYPLTFWEYLQADGRDLLLDKLRQMQLGGDEMVGRAAGEIYQEYLQVGGMPEAVANFVKDHSYVTLSQIQRRLYESYMDDIAKYAKNSLESDILRVLIDQSPKVAGGVFTYENLSKSEYLSRDVSRAMEKMERVRLIYQVMAINSVNLPAFPKSKRPKKMIWLDMGIANMVNNATHDIVHGVYEGRMMEQAVGQALWSMSDREKEAIYYWGRNRNEGAAEVDFVLQRGKKLVAFEVKSGVGREMKSLYSMMDLGGETIVPIRVSWDNPGIEKYRYNNKEYKILSIPFYLLDRWEELARDYDKE